MAISPSHPIVATLLPVGWAMIWLLWVAAVVLLFPFSIAVYNRHNTMRQGLNEKQANISIAVGRRLTLVAQALETAKRYADHELQVQIRVSENMLRSSTNAASASAYVSRLVDAYPVLRADGTFLRTIAELRHVEDDIQSKREEFNASCQSYNSSVTRFPTVLLTWPMGFRTRAYA